MTFAWLYIFQIQFFLLRSILIADEDDFVGVCDYLFYAQVATANKNTMAIFEKVSWLWATKHAVQYNFLTGVRGIGKVAVALTGFEKL